MANRSAGAEINIRKVPARFLKVLVVFVMEIKPSTSLEEAATTSVAPGGASSRARRSLVPFYVLRNRNYALLFWGQLISAVGSQMQVVAVAWQVYLLTHSALALGLIGLMQALPRLLFSLVGGVLADVLNRRQMLLIVNIIMMLLSVAVALCTAFQAINLIVIFLFILCNATTSSFEFPTRQAIIPHLISREQLADAIALDSVMVYFIAVVGATVGGLTLAWLGIANVYWLNVVSYLVVIVSLLLLRVPSIPAEKRAQAGLKALSEGIRFLRTHPVILALLTLDFCATFFASPRALLPVYARDIMHIGPQGLGLLLAAGGIGGMALTPFMGLITRIRRQGLGVALAIIIWGLCIIAFGLFPNPFWLGFLFLVGEGAADMTSVLLQGIVVQYITPDELRGRISSVAAMFVIGGPMLGQCESGLIAGLFTPMFSIVSGGVVCILAVVLILVLVPGLIKVEVR
ncbi:MAG TPA: MFS transporter [Ktedonobacteraceae bacterium]|nr:MFS transporter [Ktedonobacteraceae bacterium]